MAKANLRFQKYGGWILVNFVIGLIPLLISAVISQSFNDNIISSYISFIYAILISGLYIYKSSRNDNEVVFWGTLIFTFLFLSLYILFPNLFSTTINDYIRANFLPLSLLVLFLVLLFSLILNFKNLEDEVEKRLNQQKHEKAAKIEQDFKGIYKQLKEENQ